MLEESFRRRRHAFLLDPMVDLRVAGTRAPQEDMWVVPDYGAATTEFIYYLGIAAFAVTRYELAYSALEEYIKRSHSGEPRDSLPEFLLWYRGLAAAHLNLYERAVADFRVLLARETSRERADTLIQIPLLTNHYRYVLAVLHERWKKPADALALYQEALESDLGLYMAHVRLAHMYRSYGMWPQAVAEARRAVAANPDDATAVRELGVILREAGQSAEAVEALAQAMAANPRDALAPYDLGLGHLRQNNPEGARSAFTRFLAIAPSRYATQITDARRWVAELPEKTP